MDCWTASADELRRWQRKDAARHLAEHIFESAGVMTEEIKSPDKDMRVSRIYRVYLLDSERSANLDAMINDARRDERARAIADLLRRVDNWGSAQGLLGIGKDTVHDLAREVLSAKLETPTGETK